jgi:hypothetical protein
MLESHADLFQIIIHRRPLGTGEYINGLLDIISCLPRLLSVSVSHFFCPEGTPHTILSILPFLRLISVLVFHLGFRGGGDSKLI